MRSGTVPHILAVGLGEASRIATQEMEYDHAHVRKLSKRLVDGICSRLDHVIRNGDPEQTYEGAVKQELCLAYSYHTLCNQVICMYINQTDIYIIVSKNTIVVALKTYKGHYCVGGLVQVHYCSGTCPASVIRCF